MKESTPYEVVSEKQRVDWVDYAKGVCIIAVVMMHTVHDLHDHLGSAGWMQAVVDFARPFRMPDFFLVSGLFLSRVISKPWRDFIDKRVIHFYYFYLLWFSIQFAFGARTIFLEQGGAAEVLRQFLVGLLYPPVGPIWFIWILPFFALTVRLTRSLPSYLVLSLACILEIAPIETKWLMLNEFCSRFVYFYAGYLFAPYIFTFASRVSSFPRFSVCGLALWGVVNGFIVYEGWSRIPVVSLLLATAGALAVISFASLLCNSGKALLIKRLGEGSIVVYLAFFFPVKSFRTVWVAGGLEMDPGLLALIVTLFGVGFPFVMQWAFERIGAGFLFKRPKWAMLQGGSVTVSSVKSL